MGSTFYSLHHHWICATKERRAFIRPDWGPRLHEYFGGTVRGLAGVPLKVGGVEDHVHALIGLKPTHCISDFVRELKKATSVWAATQHEPQFEWQEGYSIFSVSASMVETVREYIEHQQEHHRKQTFVEELKALLTKHGVKYRPKVFALKTPALLQFLNPKGWQKVAGGRSCFSGTTTGRVLRD